MKYRNKEIKIELDTFTKGGFYTLDWLDPDKMDEMIYTNLKKDKKKLKKVKIKLDFNANASYIRV
jgi:hypothetical protein